jgi:hypothetical protein
MVMLSIFFALSAGIFGGTAAGGFVNWWLLRRHAKRVPVNAPTIDPALDRQINQAANQWAAAHHRPEAAALVAGKLRLAYVLQQRRARRHRRRWSR